jgi:hypothetical protein
VGDTAQQLAQARQAYSVLDGRFTAYREETTGRIDTLSTQVNSLLDELAQAKRGNGGKPPAPAAAPTSSNEGLTEEQLAEKYRDVLGPDALEGIRDWARFEARKVAGAAVKESVAPMVEDLGNIHRGSFAARMEAGVPDIAVINADPEFAKWAWECPPESDTPRQVTLMAKAQALDAPGCIKIYDTFKQSGRYHPAAAPPVAAPAAPAAVQTRPLTERVAPGGGSDTSSGGRPAVAKTFKESEVRQFYVEGARGKFKGKSKADPAVQAAYDEYDREVTLAGAEGRILKGA